MARYHLEWLAGPSRKYSPVLVREFYASYVATIMDSTPKGKRYLLQPCITETMVRGVPVDIFNATIHRFLFGPEYRPQGL